MSDDQDGCEWVSFLLVPAYPDSPRPTAVKRLCVCNYAHIDSCLGARKSICIWPVKIERGGVDVVICLERGADFLHMVQLMPLPYQNPIISCLI